jgi:hypothetical protein
MSKQCKKCSKAVANRHIGTICTECTGILPSGEMSEKAASTEAYSQYVNQQLTNKVLPYSYPEWLKRLGLATTNYKEK